MGVSASLGYFGASGGDLKPSGVARSPEMIT